MRYKILFAACLLGLTATAYSQKADTIRITADKINTKMLKTGTHRYMVYFKTSPTATRTMTQFWTRNIERSTVEGKPVLIVTQEWEDKDSIVHTVKSVCEEATMKPISHEFWWKQRFGTASVDFTKQTIVYNGNSLSDADTAKQRKMVWEGFKKSWDKYYLNWHLDLEVFPVLPYKNGVTFLVPYYDPGTASEPQQVAYTVTGSGSISGYDNQNIDCWILKHESKGNKEYFWISKKTREVLKLEQEINGRIYRYKVKMGFFETNEFFK